MSRRLGNWIVVLSGVRRPKVEQKKRQAGPRALREEILLQPFKFLHTCGQQEVCDSAVARSECVKRTSLERKHQRVRETVSQFFIGGVADADYILTYLITFSDGPKDAFDAVISVRTFMGL